MASCRNPGSASCSVLPCLIRQPPAGIPRAELYLRVANASELHQRALAAGAVELSPMLLRDWGHQAAYSLDPDGHVLAFASLAHRD